MASQATIISAISSSSSMLHAANGTDAPRRAPCHIIGSIHIGWIQKVGNIKTQMSLFHHYKIATPPFHHMVIWSINGDVRWNLLSSTQPPTLSGMENEQQLTGYCQSEGLAWLIEAVVCLIQLETAFSYCLLTRTVDGRIVRCNTINSCQSAATSEILVKSAIISASLFFLFQPKRSLRTELLILSTVNVCEHFAIMRLLFVCVCDIMALYECVLID